MRKLLALLLLLLPLLAQAGTVTGNIQTASSGAVVNGTLTFSLNQFAVVSGTAQVVATGVQCYTSTAGAITGEPDPQTAPVLSVNLGSGTLAAGTYFVKYTYFDGTGESLPSPEASVTLVSQGTVIVAVPAIQPANATGWRVSISAATGTETRQSSQTGFAASYQQTAALSAGTALPGSNTSACSIRFTDELIPSTTFYTINLVNAQSSKIAGYPISQARFYGGTNGSVNVSSGWPVSIGGVIWPSPIVSTPNSNATQSIAGGLNINGPVSVGGTLGAKCVNGVCDAANATGPDWCAKATNAAAALSGSVGKITISAAAGTSVCAAALVVPSNVTLEWTQTGTWTTSCAGITSTSTTNIELKGQKGVVITKPNSCANFSRTFLGTSVTGASIHDIEWNGNGNNQAVGEQSPDIFFNDSSRIHIYRNYMHDAQGDNIQINSDANSLCDDILIENNSFNNMGRDPVTLTGFGCNNFRVLANYMNLGTLVTTSTSHGNAVHLEADNSGSIMFQGIVISDNTALNQNGVCYSLTAVTGTPILGAIVTNNTCSGTNTVLALSGGVLLLQVQGATITGNSVRWTGAAAGNNCYLVEDTPGVSAQTHRTVFADNICDGATGNGIAISASEASGIAQAFNIHDNIINGTTGPGIDSEGVASDISIHHNLITNSQAQGIKVNGAARFSVDNNIVRDFGLGGGSIDGIMITCGLAIGPGLVHDNTVGSSTTTSKTGIHALCSSTGNTFFYNNFLTDNATPQTLAVGNIGGFSGQPEANAPTGIAGLDFLWADSTAHRWKMLNNNGTAQAIAGFLDNLSVFATGGTIAPALYSSLANCTSTGGTCVAAPAGAVTIAAAATTATVATTAVTANSDIMLTRNNGLGTRLSVTCNTQSSLVLGTAYVSAISAGVSFTITIDVAPTTNPLCISYSIIN